MLSGLQEIVGKHEEMLEGAAGPSLDPNVSLASPAALAKLRASMSRPLSKENAAYRNEHMVYPLYGFRKTTDAVNP